MQILSLTRRALLATASCLLVACAHTSTQPTGGAIPVETTFSTLNSFVQGVGGRYVSVNNLVPIGASPETYQPTPQDVAKLHDARLVIENGTGIDAWVDKIVRSAGNANLRIVVATDGMPVVGGNPHLWMNPQYAKIYVGKIRAALVAIDPAHAAQYRRNAAAYDRKLDALTRSVAAQIATIPPKQRLMIVFHDAWPYYAKQFHLQIVGSIVPAPGQEPNPQDLAKLVTLARSRHVRAIFAEPEYSAKLAQALAKSADIHVISDLYDDSIGTNPRVHDYISMLQYDTRVIVKALR